MDFVLYSSSGSEGIQNVIEFLTVLYSFKRPLESMLCSSDFRLSDGDEFLMWSCFIGTAQTIEIKLSISLQTRKQQPLHFATSVIICLLKCRFSPITTRAIISIPVVASSIQFYIRYLTAIGV